MAKKKPPAPAQQQAEIRDVYGALREKIVVLEQIQRQAYEALSEGRRGDAMKLLRPVACPSAKSGGEPSGAGAAA